jgi:hypothetical protein
MTWEGLFQALDASGHVPEELDYMENYGAIAAARHEALGGRHVRCLFGTLRIDGDLAFDVYLFPSPEEAREFTELVEAGTIRIGNLAARVGASQRERLRGILESL